MRWKFDRKYTDGKISRAVIVHILNMWKLACVTQLHNWKLFSDNKRNVAGTVTGYVWSMELAILVLSVMWKQCFRVLHRVLNVVTSIILLSSLVEWNGSELFWGDLKVTEWCREIFSRCTLENQWCLMSKRWLTVKLLVYLSKYFATRSRRITHGSKRYQKFGIIGSLQSSSQAGSPCLIYLF